MNENVNNLEQLAAFKWKAVVLSPERFKQRRELFYKRINAADTMLANRVEWFKGQEIQERIIPAHFPKSRRHPHFYLATIAHRDIIETAYVQGYDYLFVLEDDAYISDDFDKVLDLTLRYVPKCWKAIMLTGGYRKQVGDHVYRAFRSFHAHGYLLSRPGMLRVWSHLDHEHRSVVDKAFAALRRREAEYFAPHKPIVFEDRSRLQGGKDT